MKTWKLRERQRAQREKRTQEPQLLVPTEKVYELGHFQSITVAGASEPDPLTVSRVGVPVDAVLPMGLVIMGDPECDHRWGIEAWFDHPGALLRGCALCNAVENLPLAPADLSDHDALEGWLNS